MEEYNEVKAYFDNLATQHTAINGFVHGNLKRLQNYYAGSPAGTTTLVLETPSVVLRENDGSTDQRYSTGLSILTSAAADNDAEDAALATCLQIMQDVLLRIKDDKNQIPEFIFELNEAKTLEPVTLYTIDHLHGYRVEIYIGDWISNQINAAVWADKP